MYDIRRSCRHEALEIRHRNGQNQNIKISKYQKMILESAESLLLQSGSTLT